MLRTIDHLHLVGIDWHIADASVFSGLESRVEEAYEKLYPHVDEIVVLATCNRFEIYMVGDESCISAASRVLKSMSGLEKHVVLHGVDAARHLFRVAAGLESMVLGEPEILGQVKRALEYALKRAYAGKILDLVFRYALKAGKRVRNETDIGKGNVGIPGAAVILAEEVLGGLEGRKAVVIGAGEAGSIIASLLVKRRVGELRIVNRSVERAKVLAEKLGFGRVRVYGFESLKEAVQDADVVFAALSVDKPVFDASILPDGIVVVDISNVSVFSGLDGRVKYYGFRDVVEVARRFAEARRSEVPKAEAIIEEELQKLVRALKQKLADEAIEAMMRFARAMVEHEVQRAVSALRGRGVDVDGIIDVLRDLAWSSARKSLRPLVVALRQAAEEGRLRMLEEVKKFFDREYAKVIQSVD